MSGDPSEVSHQTIVKSGGGPRVVRTQLRDTQLVAAQPVQVLVEQGSHAAPVVVAERDPQLVRAEQEAPRVVLAGVRGRPGRDATGSGVTYTQDSEPRNAQENESWYNPLTLQLKVFHSGAWRPVSPDGGYF